ncbi:hypothetical protein AVEN_241744-1 [Araneus ventricosus]|uniref:Uncharacterized protein n=1 Tax=Araneus ventricosus TaxID=182803 RepID=A0A4Y2GQQ9_ARAVE|nr:hypothetical protein AVEN_241744-1 [Araneus ventricosus]
MLPRRIVHLGETNLCMKKNGDWKKFRVPIGGINRVSLSRNLRKCYRRFASTFLPFFSAASLSLSISENPAKIKGRDARKGVCREKKGMKSTLTSLEILHATFRPSIRFFCPIPSREKWERIGKKRGKKEENEG